MKISSDVETLIVMSDSNAHQLLEAARWARDELASKLQDDLIDADKALNHHTILDDLVATLDPQVPYGKF